MNQQTLKPYQSIKDFAKIMGFSEFYVRKGVKEGTIDFIRSGNKFYVNLPAYLKREGLKMADLEHSNNAN